MTKKQRHQIYKKALKILTNKNYDLGICYALYKSTDWLRNNPSYICYIDIIKEYFEECALFEPSDNTKTYWFELSDNFPRQIILDFCIEMTK